MNVNWLEFTPLTVASSNLALNGVANQSSTTHNGEASRAIDGNTNGNYSSNSVTHTAAEDNAWWTLDLATESNVEEIKIYNRTDNCCVNRLSDFTLFAWDVNGNRTIRNFVRTAPSPSVTINTGGVLIKSIRIQSNLPGTPLSLAEVEVFGTSTRNNANLLAENLDTKESLELIVYPNPTSNQFTVKTEETLAFYTMLNYAGKILSTGKINEGSAIIDISELPSGLYFVRVDGLQNSYMRKIIKQ